MTDESNPEVKESKFKKFVKDNWKDDDKSDLSDTADKANQKKITPFYQALKDGKSKTEIEAELRKLKVFVEGDSLSTEEWENLSALRTLVKTSFCPGAKY